MFTATLPLSTLGERDELYHAMTKPEWRPRLLLRCRFAAALPSVTGEGGQQLYREGAHQVDVALDEDFVFAPNLHGYVYSGIEGVGQGTAQLVTRAVRWNGRTHQYFQEDRTPYLFRYLPDGVYLTRTAERPFTPNVRVRFESSDGSLENMRALVEYAATPVVDGRRLANAAQQLASHLPSQLPAGVSGPLFEPLVVTDPDKLRLDLAIPRAGGSGSATQTRAGVAKNLADPFSDQLSDLTIAGFPEIFDALFGNSAVVFSGALNVGEQGSRAATSIPFIARLKDLYGPILAIDESQSNDGTISLKVSNASESPVVIRSLPAQLAAKNPDRVVAAQLEGLSVAGAAVAFPVELAADQALTARVVADGREPPPTLARGATGPPVRSLQRALVKAGRKIDVDGDFGPATEGAVKAVQKAKGLPGTGVADPATSAALGIRGRAIALTGAVEGRYDLSDVDERPDPNAVWDAIFDSTVPAEYRRVVKVVALEEWFKPQTDVSAIAIDFENGDEVVLRPGQLEAEANIRVPLKDLILRKQQDSDYRYTQVTIRGTQRTREEKTDNLDILFPEMPS